MKVQLIKLIVFLALMGGFYAFDGFDRPVLAQDDYRSPRRVGRAWIATVTIFMAGSALAVWGNGIAQHLGWNIPDGLYPMIGGLLLIAGFVWMLMVRDSLRV